MASVICCFEDEDIHRCLKLLYFSKACAGKESLGEAITKMRLSISCISWSCSDWSFRMCAWPSHSIPSCRSRTLKHEMQWIEPLHSYDCTSMPAGLNERWSFFAAALFTSLGEDADNLFNWWKCTKYILFRNQRIQTSGHLSCRTPFRQRSKQNSFSRMPTWQMMYLTISEKQSETWLRSIAHWIRSHLPMHNNTHKVIACGGSSRAPGCWHPRSSCPLHYSFFTDVEPL